VPEPRVGGAQLGVDVVGSERGEKTLVFTRGKAASENLARNDSGTIARWLALPSTVEGLAFTTGIISVFGDELGLSKARGAVAASGHGRSRIAKGSRGMPRQARVWVAKGACRLQVGWRRHGRARLERRRRTGLVETPVHARVGASEPAVDGRFWLRDSRLRQPSTSDQQGDEDRLRGGTAHRALRPLRSANLGPHPSLAEAHTSPERQPR
jgi:hypothetical protein